MTGAELEQLVLVANDFRLSRSIYLMSLILVLYDFVLTLPSEVTFMWKGKFSWRHVIFVILRYLSILNLTVANIVLSWNKPSARLCSIWYNGWVAANIPIAIVSGIVLILRIGAMYAMFAHRLKILVALSIMFGVKTVVELVILFRLLSHLISVPLPPPYSGCFGVSGREDSWIYWLPTIAFETCLVILAIIQCIQYVRDESGATRLMAVLLRDSIMFFGGMLAAALINCIIWGVGRPTLFSAFPSIHTAFGSVLGCRMLLNAREAVNPWSHYDSRLFAMTGIVWSNDPPSTENIPLTNQEHIDRP